MSYTTIKIRTADAAWLRRRKRETGVPIVTIVAQLICESKPPPLRERRKKGKA